MQRTKPWVGKNGCPKSVSRTECRTLRVPIGMLDMYPRSICRMIKPDALLLNMLRTEIESHLPLKTKASISISAFSDVESREQVDVCTSLLSLAQFGKPPALHQFHSSHADLQPPTTFNYIHQPQPQPQPRASDLPRSNSREALLISSCVRTASVSHRSPPFASRQATNVNPPRVPASVQPRLQTRTHPTYPTAFTSFKMTQQSPSGQHSPPPAQQRPRGKPTVPSQSRESEN